MIGLSKKGQVYVWGQFSLPLPQEEGKLLDFSQEIKPLTFCSPVHLTYEGTLYGWGDDSENKYGVLGLGNQYKSLRPCPNSQLFDFMIKNVSLGETHACAVDSNGRLFSWGYGPNGELGIENCNSSVNAPTIVTKQKQINIKKAIAHLNYTALCSSKQQKFQPVLGAGYVYLFGTLHPNLSKFQQNQPKLTSSSNNLQPFLTKSISEGISSKVSQNIQSSRPLNSMVQVLSLSECFISEVVGGDSFLIGLTSQGDVYFIDDALESVQINTTPIDQIAIQGSKIIGISQKNRLIEWSTAGLNKLSFNKENKLLLRQDFQTKEYQIQAQFAQNTEIFNLALSKNFVGIVYADLNDTVGQFQTNSQNDDGLGNLTDKQLVIATLNPNANKQNHYNPMCSESSVDQSHDHGNHQKEEGKLQNDQEQQLNDSQHSFQNTSVPEISITGVTMQEEPKMMHQNPSLILTTLETQQNDSQYLGGPSQFMNEHEIQNIFTYQREEKTDSQKQQQLSKPPQQVSTGNLGFNQNVCTSSNIFFLDQSNNQLDNVSNFGYRPSSIKSGKQGENYNKSENNNSSPSLKQCADQMQPLGRTSKMNISYPSFLNLSNDKQDQQNDQVSNNGFSPNVNQNQLTEKELQNAIKFEVNDGMQEYKFSIKVNPSMSASHSESGSREASIVNRIRREEDFVEESMIITHDSFLIKAKRTTTPRRLLHSYSRRSQTSKSQASKSQISQSESQSDNHNPMLQPHSEAKSNQSELSSGFNITANSIAINNQLNGRPTMDNLNPNISHRYNNGGAQNLQVRPSNITQNDMSSINRQSLGVGNQTEENFQLDYTISNSSTPESKTSNIIRKINFDDASGETGGVIRYSDYGNATRFITSFTVNIQDGRPQNEQSQIQLSKQPSNVSQQIFKNDQSASFIFNQCQSPIQQQPFVQDNPVSNIKSSSTPSHQGNSTQMMMLTEEKFKNLRSEISQQQIDQPLNQFLITQNTLLSSPMMNDYNNFTKDSSRSMLLGQTNGNIQNFSTFVKNSKYLQVYENFRKGLIILDKLKHSRTVYSFRKIKRVSQDKKQRTEFLQNLSRFLSNMIKGHFIQQKQYAFKKIKKHLKEKQIQKLIQKQQNAFALQISSMVKIDQFINNQNNEAMKQAFSQIFSHYQRVKKSIEEKRKKALSLLFATLTRKSKNIQEKTLRSIINWSNEKKILEMNLKIMTRIINKIVSQQKKQCFVQFKEGINIRRVQKNLLEKILNNIERRAFAQFRENCQRRSKKIEGFLRLSYSYTLLQQRLTQISSLELWHKETQKLKVLRMIIQRQETKMTEQLKAKFIRTLKMMTHQRTMREQKNKLTRAMLMIIFKKISEINKRNMKHGFEALLQYYIKPEETVLINNTMSNLSFNMNNNSEISLILKNRKEANLIFASQVQQDPSINEYLYKTQDMPLQQRNNKINETAKGNYLTKGKTQRSSNKKKPALNDYLSYSPYQQQMQQKNSNQFQFQMRRKTEAPVSQKEEIINQEPQNPNKTHNNYLDCPIPLSVYQEKQKQKQQQELQELSIKQMNNAFRDQISRIKERQDEYASNVSSYLSSANGFSNNQDYSYDQKKILEIEYSQTPDQFINQSNELLKKKQNRGKENASPQINPLCTSESQHVMNGLVQFQLNKVSTDQPTFQTSQHQKVVPLNLSLLDKNNKIESNNTSTISRNKIVELPHQSTFGDRDVSAGNYENITNSIEAKFTSFNKTITTKEFQMTFREQNDSNFEQGQTTNQRYGGTSGISRKKSDLRYNNNPTGVASVLEQDYSLDFDQQHDMFDEFDKEEKESRVNKMQSTHNLGISQVKSSIADLSKKIDFSQINSTKMHDSMEQIDINKHNSTQQNFDMNQQIKNAYQQFQQQMMRTKSSKTIIKQQSPTYTEDSFIPTALNRELLNEMAQNYQMMELTPETDYQMLLNNKSTLNREESIYSNNNYAEPMEMALSPRTMGALGLTNNDISAINQNVTTTQTYFNFGPFGDTQQQKLMSELKDDMFDEEENQVEESRESRPYDFELSSNSKYKIISENQQAKTIIQSQLLQPSKIVQHNNICKKLTFGYDQSKRKDQQNNNTSKQKSTFLVSGGEQTINFNLTQEDEEEGMNIVSDNKIYSDEEMEVGEEIPAEITNKFNQGLPESHIQQLDGHQERFNLNLSQADLKAIAQNRMQKMQTIQSMNFNSRNSHETRRSPQTARDFISSNIEKLKNIVKGSPKHLNEYQIQTSSLSSVNSSTRNISQRSFGLFNSRTNPKYSSQQSQPQSSTNCIPQKNHSQVSKSIVGLNKNKTFDNQSNNGSLSRRAESKENIVRMSQQSKPSFDKGSLRRSGTNYQPLTFRMPSTASVQNSQNSNNGSIIEQKRISYDYTMDNSSHGGGSFSHRGGIPNNPSNQYLHTQGIPRNPQQYQMQGNHSSRNNSMTKGYSSMQQSKNNSTLNLRQFQ